MRLRNIPRAESVIAESSLVVKKPSAQRGAWRRYFGSKGPLHVEIGMGKGRFLTDMAALHPEICYIGIERYTSVLLRAVERAEQMSEDGRAVEQAEQMPEAGRTNFVFLCQDAAALPEIFAPGEVDRLYLNFSDPWPKERHAKRRLTSVPFLRLYEQVLSADGTLEFKTDNQALFAFSLESVREAGWRLLGQTRDLHRDSMGIGNVMTEYEEKFSAKGNPICKLVAAPGKS